MAEKLLYGLEIPGGIEEPLALVDHGSIEDFAFAPDIDPDTASVPLASSARK